MIFIPDPQLGITRREHAIDPAHAEEAEALREESKDLARRMNRSENTQISILALGAIVAVSSFMTDIWTDLPGLEPLWIGGLALMAVALILSEPFNAPIRRDKNELASRVSTFIDQHGRRIPPRYSFDDFAAEGPFSDEQEWEAALRLRQARKSIKAAKALSKKVPHSSHLTPTQTRQKRTTLAKAAHLQGDAERLLNEAALILEGQSQ